MMSDNIVICQIYDEYALTKSEEFLTYREGTGHNTNTEYHSSYHYAKSGISCNVYNSGSMHKIHGT